MKQLLLLYCFIISAYLTVQSQVPQSERDALIAFFNATNGSTNWNDNTNWASSAPVSSWYGITTSFINDVEHISEIDLNTNSVLGIIPNEITNLTYLNYLDLRNNILYDEIPENFGDLQNLTWIDLRFNSLTGNIPTSITTISNLSVFIVSGNSLSGDIPNFTSQILNQLSFVWIENNAFQFGDFEDEFVAYNTNLGTGFSYTPQNLIGERVYEAAAVGDNISFTASNVSGTQNSYTWYRINADGSEGGFIGNGENINITINTADDYKWFYFYEVTNNIVSGLTLRSDFYTIGDLPSNHPDYDALIAIFNAFDGANWNTPWEINKPINNWSNSLGFDPITNRLNSLELSSNGIAITGTIPMEIGNLIELETLIILGNDISGEIPAELWTLTKLKMLILGGQQSKQLLLSGGIPVEIANLQDLEWLNLTGIPLTQPLQPELFLLPKLARLRIVECGLTGTLPKELALIDNVLASGNEFEGAIPQEFINSIGNSNLQIQNNFFNFSDLEPLVMSNSYTTLGYSPQRTKDIAQNLEYAPGADIILNIDDTSLNKAITSKGSGDEYQWYKDNVAINGANAISYTILNAQEADSGVYYCEINNNLLPNLTINRANITILIDAALSTEELVNNDLKIYPNPTKKLIHIKLSQFNKSEASLYDVSGRLVLKQKLESEISKMDINKLESGMYLLQIETENKSITKRIIKE